MDLLILNSEFESISLIDSFESLIWTDRYCRHGDFELYSSSIQEIINTLKHNYYVWSAESEHGMIIEHFEIKSDVEIGNKILVSGRSFESILLRRIIWRQTTISGSLQNGIEKLLIQNVIDPFDEDRKIPNFIFELSDDPAITNLTIEAQFTGQDLHEAINKICEAAEIGFKITLNDDNKFVFKLYAGKDRSYNQIVNPYVVFSPNFENIINSNYLESTKTIKNVTLVAGEGEGADRKTVSVGTGVGINRRELFTDARDLSQTVDNVLIPMSDYEAQLTYRGLTKLNDYIFVSTFEGQVDSTRMYKFGTDFFLGDIVQLTNEFGVEARVRVAEVVMSQSTSGIDIYPTFTTID